MASETTIKRRQGGYLNLDGIGTLMVFGLVGIAATIAGVCWLVYWLWSHLAWV